MLSIHPRRTQNFAKLFIHKKSHELLRQSSTSSLLLLLSSSAMYITLECHSRVFLPIFIASRAAAWSHNFAILRFFVTEHTQKIYYLAVQWVFQLFGNNVKWEWAEEEGDGCWKGCWESNELFNINFHSFVSKI